MTSYLWSYFLVKNITRWHSAWSCSFWICWSDWIAPLTHSSNTSICSTTASTSICAFHEDAIVRSCLITLQAFNLFFSNRLEILLIFWITSFALKQSVSSLWASCFRSTSCTYWWHIIRSSSTTNASKRIKISTLANDILILIRMMRRCSHWISISLSRPTRKNFR